MIEYFDSLNQKKSLFKWFRTLRAAVHANYRIPLNMLTGGAALLTYGSVGRRISATGRPGTAAFLGFDVLFCRVNDLSVTYGLCVEWGHTRTTYRSATRGFMALMPTTP